jgi:hypothetical protein
VPASVDPLTSIHGLGHNQALPDRVKALEPELARNLSLLEHPRVPLEDGSEALSALQAAEAAAMTSSKSLAGYGKSRFRSEIWMHWHFCVCGFYEIVALTAVGQPGVAVPHSFFRSLLARCPSNRPKESGRSHDPAFQNVKNGLGRNYLQFLS